MLILEIYDKPSMNRNGSDSRGYRAVVTVVCVIMWLQNKLLFWHEAFHCNAILRCRHKKRDGKQAYPLAKSIRTQFSIGMKQNNK